MNSPNVARRSSGRSVSPELVIVLLGLLLAGALWAGDLWNLRAMHVSPSAMLGRDFVNVWLGGHLARVDETLAIYDIPRYMAIIGDRFGIRDLYAYSYPPHSLLLAVPFSLLPYSLALGLWTVGGMCVFYIAARPYLQGAGFTPWLAVLLPAGFVNIWAGQYGFLIGALALYGWHCVERHPARAGICFGLMALKPHLAVLVGLALLLQGRWRTIGYAVLTLAVTILLSGFCFGFDLWAIYITRTLAFHSGLLNHGVAAFHGMMPTTTAALVQLHAPQWLVAGGQTVSAGYALLIVWLAIQRKFADLDLGLLVATATFLVLPYAFNYDMVIVSLAVAVLFARNGEAFSPAARALLGAAWLLPLLLGPGRHFTALGPPVLAGLLRLQLRAGTRKQATAPRAVPAGAGAGR